MKSMPHCYNRHVHSRNHSTVFVLSTYKKDTTFVVPIEHLMCIFWTKCRLYTEIVTRCFYNPRVDEQLPVHCCPLWLDRLKIRVCAQRRHTVWRPTTCDRDPASLQWPRGWMSSALAVVPWENYIICHRAMRSTAGVVLFMSDDICLKNYVFTQTAALQATLL